MKKLPVKELFGLAIFFLIVLFSLLVIQPVYRRTAFLLDKNVRNLCSAIEKKYGVSVSYGSLSPSIFSALYVRGIVISDSYEKDSVLEIKKAVLRYNFFKLISGSPKESLKDLTVDGVVLEINRDDNNTLLEKFFPSKKTRTADFSADEKKYFDLQKTVRMLPFDLFVKNVHIQFTDRSKIFDFFLKKLNLDIVPDLHQISVKTYGSVIYSDETSRRNLSASFSMDGTVFDSLNGSLLNVRFSELTDGNYRFNRLNMRVSYDNNTAELRTIQNAYPFYLFCSYNFDSNDILVSLKTQNLVPGRLFSARRESGMFRKLKFVSAGINVFADYNIKSGTLNYSSDGNFKFSDKVMRGGLETSYSLSGNEKQVSVKSAEISGKMLNADFEGTFVFDGMRLSGSSNVYNYTLANGGVISTELYFDPLEKGFMCFSPQLLFDSKSFTALQLTVLPQSDSVDFSFELSDYAHYDTEKPGSVKIDGSFILDTKYLQANMTADGMYLDSAVQTAAFFAESGKKSEYSFLSPFMFNTELYFSSDLRTYSYNIPYFVVANTKKDNQFVYVSLDGNDSSLQVSKFDVISGGQMAQFSALVERLPDSNEAFIMADANFGSIPYHFTGRILPGSVSVSGDYALAFDMHKSGRNRYDGAFSIESMPVSFADTILAFSADTGFSYSGETGMNLGISRIKVQEAGGKYNFSPELTLSGNISKYGAFLNEIKYSDIFSSLSGKSQLLWNINNGIFDSADFSLKVSGERASEDITVSAAVSNPEGVPVSGSFIKHNMYVNSQVVLKKFNLNRFTAEINDMNSISATVIAAGTLDNPYIGFNIDSLGFMTDGKTVQAKCSAYVEEKIFALEDTELKVNDMKFSKVSASFDLSSFSGRISAVLDTAVMKKSVHAPFEISVSDTFVKEGSFVPSEFAVNFRCPEVSGTLFNEVFPVEFSVLHSSEVTSVFTSELFGISGTVARNGDVSFSIEKGKPVYFSFNGNIYGNELKLQLSDVRVDAGKLFSYVDIPKFKVYKGVLRGSAEISGVKKDPDFTGNFVIDGADFSLPSIIPSHITVPKINALLNHTQLDVPEVKGLIKNNYSIFGSAAVYMNGWAMDRLEAKVRTPKNSFAPADFNIRLAEVKGDAAVDLGIVFADGYLDVSGDIAVKNATARAKTKEIAAGTAPARRSFFIRSDLSISLLQHCSFRFDPLLRAVFTPNSYFKFKYDMEDSSMQIDGEIALRSGDIAYLNRNFYLKNGIIRFNRNETTFNPIITLTAETREKDSGGNDVRLILSASNQYLFNFNPQISSIPAKSEAEISQMLGQLAVGDSENISGFLLSAGDYALQSTVGRNIENKLRDFFNFDILSVRTSVLQNALKLSLSSNNSDSEKKSFGIGNYLDNSTVYIGKYFGSSLYADALLHWSYDESRVDDRTTAGGLVFQPEIGLEMESPLANIRWNMAPDISALMNSRLVASTSVTLSWKFSF